MSRIRSPTSYVQPDDERRRVRRSRCGSIVRVRSIACASVMRRDVAGTSRGQNCGPSR